MLYKKRTFVIFQKQHAIVPTYDNDVKNVDTSQRHVLIRSNQYLIDKKIAADAGVFNILRLPSMFDIYVHYSRRFSLV